ncbi:MAG: hypothetical protein NUV92_02790 [Ignavibacteria bacterium]|nr:hypothetical protein [Ignavibacteria bacterium]MDH7527160.1 hypothetical protein [Ignavibacteria bacterium]
MGNKVLIITSATLLLIIFVVLNLRGSSTRITDQVISAFNIEQAKYIANSALNITLNKLRLNKKLRGNFNDNLLLGGSYNVSIKGTDTVLISVNANYMKQKANASVITIWNIITLPKINAAMSISSSNIDISLHGNILISGIDKNSDGTPGTSQPVSGISVENINDSIRIVNGIPNNVKPQIIGSTPFPSVLVNQNSQNLSELINQYIQSADIILPSGTYSTGTILGTPEEPKITFISGNANFAGNASGAGILIIYGDMSCAGNFSYQGLVIVYGNTQISASASGNSAIYGGMLVVGPSVDISATGSAVINYSSRAINNIQQKLKSSKFIVSNWVDW